MVSLDPNQTRHFVMSDLGPSCLPMLSAGPEVTKLFPCSTQLSMKFQLLIKTKILTNKEVSCLSLSGIVLIMLINVKMPTIVGILSFMSRINFLLS